MSGIATETDRATINTLSAHKLTTTSNGPFRTDRWQASCGCGDWTPPPLHSREIPAAHDEHLVPFIPDGTPTAPCPTCNRVLVQVAGNGFWYHADASGFHGHGGMDAHGKPW